MNPIEAIKERYNKLYILADEDTHKLIAVMKADILFLLSIAETKVDDVKLVQQMTANDIIDTIVERYNIEVVIDENKH